MAFRERIFRSVPAATPLAPRKHDINEVLTLRLGDVLDRLPKQFLASGDHDLTRPLVFEITKLAKQIILGRQTIELVEVYRQLPAIFASEVKTSDNVQVQFPWPRLVEMLRAAHKNTSEPGLTRAGALHLARLLRGIRPSGGDKNASRAAASAKATQSLPRNAEAGDSAEGERILEELATILEKFAPGEATASNPVKEHQIEKSDALALTVEENTRLRNEIEERDCEIESLKKALSEMETSAIDQIAALNQQWEIETAKNKVPIHQPEQVHQPEHPLLNPQQTALIDSLTQQVAELFVELDKARDDSLQATAAHAKYRKENEAAAEAAASTQQYLESVAYELERANALLKEMEAKSQHTEKVLFAKDTDLQRITQELMAFRKEYSDVCAERDALRGRLYAYSPTAQTGT